MALLLWNVDLDPLTLSIGGQGDVGDVGGRAALIVAILDNDEPQAKRLLAGLKRDAREQMLQSHLHSGHSAAHMAVMFNRVWALKLLRQQGMDLSVPLRCHADVSQPSEPVMNLQPMRPSAFLCTLLSAHLHYQLCRTLNLLTRRAKVRRWRGVTEHQWIIVAVICSGLRHGLRTLTQSATVVGWIATWLGSLSSISPPATPRSMH